MSRFKNRDAHLAIAQHRKFCRFPSLAACCKINGRFRKKRPSMSGRFLQLVLSQTAVLLVSGSGLITLDADRSALGVITFVAFDHRIVPVRRRLDGMLAF